MDFIISHYIQLSIALFAGAALFIVAYVAPARVVVTLLLLTIPFQLIDSRFGTLNMFVTYLVGFAFLLKGRIRHFPLFWIFILICFIYLLSMTQALRATYFEHIIYIISIGANFVIFYVVYNHFRKDADIQQAFDVFIGVATLVVIYCFASLAIGFDTIALFGVDELTFGGNLEEKQRLIGPFNSAGINSEFLAIQILLLGYILMFEAPKWKRGAILLLLMACFGFMVATGSRGGFLALLIGAFIFFLKFRGTLGVKRMVGAGAIVILFGLTAVTVINLTQYNVLFDRLAATEFEGVVPDSRVGGWRPAISKSMEKPLLGHGPGEAPTLRLLNEGLRNNPEYKPLWNYPHNLYIFLLYTTGILGLTIYLVLFGVLFRRWWVARGLRCEDAVLCGVPSLGLVLMALFLISQYRIEFLRFILNDYQNYIFALWAMLLAFTDVLKGRSNSYKVSGSRNNRSSAVKQKDFRLHQHGRTILRRNYRLK